jgi:thiamine-monophosphate kinase
MNAKSDKSLKQIGEFGLIAHLEKWLAPMDPSILAGIGDDASVVKMSDGSLKAMSIDTIVEGRHFNRSFMAMKAIGYRLAVSNASDMAAMGATPEYALVSCAFPPDMPLSDVRDLYDGISEGAKEYGFEIVGGDTVAAREVSVFTMSITGGLSGGNYRTRRSARAGDIVMVTGFPGEARLGLLSLQGDIHIPRHDAYFHTRFLRPFARVREGRMLSAESAVRSMMDISDGLISDLRRICSASGVGVRIDEETLPLGSKVRDLFPTLHLSPAEVVLKGGEDFELLLTVAPETAGSMKRTFEEHTGIPLTAIGEVTEEKGICRLVKCGGERVILPEGGWDHFAFR